MITDDFIFPIGKFKGQKIGNVPASYLLWLNEKIEHTAPNKRNAFEAAFVAYVKENIDVLNKENGKKI